MEKEVAVRMTNFATILNDLAASFEGRNEYISRLCSYPLLILDDFGTERGTEYGDVYKRQAQMIATITRQQVGTVERALQIFMIF